MSETVRQQYSNFTNFFKRILNRKKKLISSYDKSPHPSQPPSPPKRPHRPQAPHRTPMAGGEGEGINGSIGVENQLISSMPQDDLQNRFTYFTKNHYLVQKLRL